MLYRFADCELDLLAHVFRRGGERVPMEPQVFELAALFVRHPGELISHDRIVDEVWGGRIVSEAAITSRIAALRRALGDSGKVQAVLETVPRCGYRFLPSVEVVGGQASSAAPPSAPPAAQRIRVTRSADGTRIAFATTGDGPPLLRAGHFLTHLEHDWESPVWRPFLDRLGMHFSVTRYDQRGTGLSDDDPPGYDLDALADDLGAVADAAGLTRFPVLAASQGVPVSLAYAARHPERVSRMVLYGGYALGRSLRGTAEERATGEAVLTMIRQGWGRDTAFADAFTTLFMPDATPEERRGMVRMQLASASPENAVALRRAIDGFDVTGLLNDVRVPVLIVHARDDAVHPLSQARVLAAGLPQAELHLLDSRNHVPLQHDPAWEELLRVSVEFLARQS
jgi:pimeloyl-ACP methyl ester carboxylesterase